jgi:hypothetical protein
MATGSSGCTQSVIYRDLDGIRWRTREAHRITANTPSRSKTSCCIRCRNPSAGNSPPNPPPPYKSYRLPIAKDVRFKTGANYLTRCTTGTATADLDTQGTVLTGVFVGDNVQVGDRV